MRVKPKSEYVLQHEGYPLSHRSHQQPIETGTAWTSWFFGKEHQEYAYIL